MALLMHVPVDRGLGFLYRYEDTLTIGFDERVSTRLDLVKLVITKRTEKGCWVQQSFQPDKFVLNSSHRSSKRYAFATIREAHTSYMARKARQIKILTAQLERAHDGARLATAISDKLPREEDV